MSNRFNSSLGVGVTDTLSAADASVLFIVSVVEVIASLVNVYET